MIIISASQSVGKSCFVKSFLARYECRAYRHAIVELEYFSMTHEKDLKSVFEDAIAKSQIPIFFASLLAKVVEKYFLVFTESNLRI